MTKLTDSRSDEYDIAVTYTAKSKAYRYLSTHEIVNAVRSPYQVYYDESRDMFLIRTDRRPDPKNFPPGTQPSKKDRIVVVVSIDEPSKDIVAVTQTQDHYKWSEYERVGSLGVPISRGEA